MTISGNDQRVTRECPLGCLGLPRRITNRLWFHLVSPDREAPTVGDVVQLWEQDELRRVQGLGPVFVAQIVTALAEAGLIHRHRHS